MFCSNCGSQLSGTEQFCSSCGKAVAGPTAVSGAPETAIASGSATTVNTGMPGRCTSAGYQSCAAGGWAAPANCWRPCAWCPVPSLRIRASGPSACVRH
ncbi:zinc-ribbon domain-containing protein [uncultured Adlercreutzia sp.]|uniref:zinc-ribbon domain-containing protein n=1 Tax=uncultured Adlercreutzia sp. TaxID=875803 RepID=UPI00350F279D